MMKTCFLCQSSDLLVKSIHDNICKYTVCLFIARDWIWDKLSFIFHFFFMKDDDAGETEQGAASSDADATNESGPESEKKKRIFSKECKWVWQFERWKVCWKKCINHSWSWQFSLQIICFWVFDQIQVSQELLGSLYKINIWVWCIKGRMMMKDILIMIKHQ